ncbi:outer membrane lipoprotein carrier protein LolA [Bordetella genomosp. 1]|uniref:Outer-membrane lipoprotein carrier protein n=1 Tax=Bordetella genomosp. 1 TaxID=1395607 RepID=A0A261SNZ3_9BORD|nr:outer membrane lipoprotein chaperone LolA [Bordetella genomosp. 1]MDQ8031727.1 outer membrane lipoprotein chaperone LolA [Bordetella sp.]OZI39104.1 outer membrane lipoprotein carrier protein LolA [Bordetella genomosp. 1]OZI65327.1 outer membrane lipoprotein carrier protein LolA [Bordetella genomosp. 1]
MRNRLSAALRGTRLGLAALLASAALLPGLSLAADAQAQLRAFVDTVKSATGNFTQSTVGAQGRTQPAQSGTFAFQRPGKFRWGVQRPYEQLIVSDGKQVYQYDPDLAQVTERKVDQAIGTSPAAILFGSGNLEQAFNVAPLPDRDGMQWLRAKPRNADAGFSQVDIGLKDNLPARVELLDSFGQTTRVELSGIAANAAIGAETFQFSAPKGVDVVKM